ncbi:MAG: hypothetical protein A2902_00195 [Elusimicrobia bacterium RIFCSPLOWO2_01_FULL_64_13]|nr:MAG: hypothetical protein A2902_00195 [Elusimicrobia bacterium RIFCSPLOWO2_01_FULL_64_13]
MDNKKTVRLILALILLFGAGVRFWGLRWGLPYEYQSEEYKIVKYALRMGSGDLNPHFFEYPSLYLYAMLFTYGATYAAGRTLGRFSDPHDFALSFVRDPTPFYLMGRAYEAAFGVLILLLIYRIGRRIFNEEAALCSAFIFAAQPQFVFMSHMIKGYMGMIALLLAFFWQCLNVAERGRLRDYVLAGILLGLAVSTRYHAAPFGIVLPAAHFLRVRLRGPHGPLLLSLFLIPVFFLAGTPYAALAPQELWKDLGGNIALSAGGAGPSYLRRLGTAASWFLTLGDIPSPRILGAALAVGFAYACFFRWRSGLFLVLALIAGYLPIVGGYFRPAGGYLLQVFPLFAMAGCYGLFSIPNKYLRAAGLGALTAGMVWNGALGLAWARSYTRPDTRTQAKEWIEANLPQGSKILIDVKVQAPPLLPSYEQLKKFRDIAAAAGNYKKEYLALQLEAHPGPGQGYEIVMVERDYRQICSLEHQVLESQVTQDLFIADGDIGRLKKAGIEYAVTEETVALGALGSDLPGIADYYRNLPVKARLVKDFEPAPGFRHSGRIAVYSLD